MPGGLGATGGRHFADLTVLLGMAHLPVMVIDAAIGAFTVAAVARLMPQALQPVLPAAGTPGLR